MLELLCMNRNPNKKTIINDIKEETIGNSSNYFNKKQNKNFYI